MKIAYLLPKLEKKGPIIVAYDLICNLIKKEEIEDICVYYFEDCTEPLDFPCKIKKIKFNDKIEMDYYDIIHSHTLRTDLYLFKNSFFNINRNKFISTIHQYNYESLYFTTKNKLTSYLISALWSFFLSRHKKIIVLSKDMSVYYRKNIFLKKKIDYIYNGRPLPKFIEDNKLNINDILKNTKNNIIIGSSCSLTTRKGLEQVIKILPKIPNAIFIIIGDGPQKNELIRLSIELDVENRVFLLGFKNNPIDYICNFDIFILPSRSEGFGLSLIEGASCKLPLVCSNIPSFRELFSENEASFFQLDDNKSLLNALYSAIKNKEKLAQNAFNKYTQEYTDEIMSKNYLNIYIQLAGIY
ncbi:glycosyltransferase family 4 protein [Xenorhabdus bovienii]|uniref:Putative WekI n=1 Tax=Xenorhabdus bovienii TaxID=40576 RepID=A0A0B6XG72_XENBV|nr:glycosyltransferase family 4 protein [Xenorhabdus bovienii]CDG86472.1 putative WekI [Xenorhabdus bovienii str. feltiae France]CDG90759.1 putative WekI [Xenorhabdus bovienii str. feltiae Florida]CDM92013.1 putative WekI [Xenorhabdus bovienii]